MPNDLFGYLVTNALFLIFVLGTLLFAIVKIWQRGVRRERQKRNNLDKP
jgi:hypothetical protein